MWKPAADDEMVSIVSEEQVAPEDIWVVIGSPEGKDGQIFFWSDHTGENILGFESKKKALRVARVLATHGMRTKVDKACEVWDKTGEVPRPLRDMISTAKH